MKKTNGKLLLTPKSSLAPLPSFLSSPLRNLRPPRLRHSSRASLSTLLSQRHRCRVFPLFRRRRRPILYLTRRNIDDELGELVRVARAFAVIRHGHRSAARTTTVLR